MFVLAWFAFNKPCWCFMMVSYQLIGRWLSCRTTSSSLRNSFAKVNSTNVRSLVTFYIEDLGRPRDRQVPSYVQNVTCSLIMIYHKCFFRPSVVVSSHQDCLGNSRYYAGPKCLYVSKIGHLAIDNHLVRCKILSRQAADNYCLAVSISSYLFWILVQLINHWMKNNTPNY